MFVYVKCVLFDLLKIYANLDKFSVKSFSQGIRKLPRNKTYFECLIHVVFPAVKYARLMFSDGNIIMLVVTMSNMLNFPNAVKGITFYLSFYSVCSHSKY